MFIKRPDENQDAFFVTKNKYFLLALTKYIH